VIDSGRGGVLLDFLTEAGIKTVDLMLISHADDDHVGYAPTLLLNKLIAVRAIYYNSDAGKRSKSWLAFAKAIGVARREHNLDAHAELTTSLSGKLHKGTIDIEILYPTPEIATSAPGGKDEAGKKLTSNSMSAVVGLSRKGKRFVLLPGDAGPACLEQWKTDKVDPRSPIVIYPHHGGNPEAADAVALAHEFCAAVRPHTIIFSIHRKLHGLPIPEVVQHARKVLAGVRIACTQLSSHCALTVPASGFSHLVDLPASGKDGGTCCAGTILIELAASGPTIRRAAAHAAFIKKAVTTPLCRSRS
jgi:competence protein ComEC